VTVHELPLERRTLHGHFSCDLQPVLTVDPGDSVRFATLNAGWRGENESEFEPRDPELDSGHALVGPIEVRGAAAGATLAVRVDTITPGSWGFTFAEDEYFHWTLDRKAWTGTDARGRSVRLAPFLGVMGMPPPEPGVHSTTPPREWGGNIDCKELVAGTTLFLPVPVDGALFSAGDGHGVQGDGEVSGTAIECPCDEVVLTLDLRSDLEVAAPLARNSDAWIAFGFDIDLDQAMTKALEGMLALLGREHGLTRPEALALSSLAVDFRITQVVNDVKGVHAVLRDDAILFP
jgi:acetamidase/formamidase